MDANPENVETLKLVIWIGSGVILLLIGVIGVLIRVYFNGHDKRLDEFGKEQKMQSKEFKSMFDSIESRQSAQHDMMREMVDSLKETVGELKTLVRLQEERQAGAGRVCVEKHQIIDRRFSEMRYDIEGHEKRITAIETKKQRN